MKRCLVVTGGGDCPGLNAVIRAIVKRAAFEQDWEIVGSIEAFNGVLREPTEIVILDEKKVAGIHYLGGTILQTTNKGGPFSWPVKNNDGTWTTVDRSDEMLRKLQYLGIDAVINIGGDGSQRISKRLYDKGLNIIGVPKTIDNDLSATDSTFGFQTAVQIATEAVDKLVTTAASHNRVLILEVMGRYAGWIALNAAVAGGAEICLLLASSLPMPGPWKMPVPLAWFLSVCRDLLPRWLQRLWVQGRAWTWRTPFASTWAPSFLRSTLPSTESAPFTGSSSLPKRSTACGYSTSA